MSARIQINQHLTPKVEVTAHPNDSDLITLQVTEGCYNDARHTSTHEFVMDRALWMQAADQLAALGVVGDLAHVDAAEPVGTQPLTGVPA